MLAKNDPAGCCRDRWRGCSSRLQEEHLAGFGARQTVREDTFGRCKVLFRPSQGITCLCHGWTEEQTQHAFGVDDTLRVAAPHLVFSVWVILNEHRWVTFP